MPRSLVTHYNIYMARLGLRSRLCRLVFFLVDLNMVIFDGVYLLGKMRWLYQTILFVGMASKKECQTWLILGYTYPPENQLGSWEDEFPGSQWWDILFVPWRVFFFFENFVWPCLLHSWYLKEAKDLEKVHSRCIIQLAVEKAHYWPH